MKKNLYYQTMYGRKNLIKEFFVGLFLSISSYPRLIIEVFIRRNFGERYFNMASVITVAILLSLPPLVNSHALEFMMLSFKSSYHYQFNWWDRLFKDNWAWFIYLIAFIFFGIKRAKEIKRNPSTFDFEKFSLYQGDIMDVFYTWRKQNWNERKIQMLLEPGLFFFGGILTYIFVASNLGALLIICSLLYSLSYWAAYNHATNFVLNKIDEKICNEEMFNSFVKNESAKKTRGFRFLGANELSEEKKNELMPYFFEDNDLRFAEAK